MSHYQLNIREWQAQQNTEIRNRKGVFDRANKHQPVQIKL